MPPYPNVKALILELLRLTSRYRILARLALWQRCLMESAG